MELILKPGMDANSTAVFIKELSIAVQCDTLEVTIRVVDDHIVLVVQIPSDSIHLIEKNAHLSSLITSIRVLSTSSSTEGDVNPPLLAIVLGSVLGFVGLVLVVSSVAVVVVIIVMARKKKLAGSSTPMSEIQSAIPVESPLH